MFWKILEFLSRIIYARRIRHVNRVGKAAALASADPEEALRRLHRMEKGIHPAVRSMHALTCGRILDGLERYEEAESRVISAAKLDPSNMHAHLELAQMSGRKFQFKNAKERALRLSEENDPIIKEKALALIEKLDAIAMGQEAKQYARRAKLLAKKPIGQNGEAPGLPADFGMLDDWIDRAPGEAAKHIEDIAFLFGESAVQEWRARWKVSLSSHHSLIVLKSKQAICPFDVVKNRFTDSSLSLLKKYSSITQ